MPEVPRAPGGRTAEPSLTSGWVYGLAGCALRSVIQRAVLFPLAGAFSPMRVRGREYLREVVPPVIVVGNHVSHLDTPTILRALPNSIRRRLVVAAARDYFYRGRIRGTLASLSMATVPFDRKEDSRASLAKCEELLRAGWSLLIFPEGTRNETGQLGRVRHGVAVLAVETGVPVLPLFVHGLAQVLPKGTVAPLPSGIVVDVGELVHPAKGDSADGLRARIEAALVDLASRRPDWGATAGREPYPHRHIEHTKDTE